MTREHDMTNGDVLHAAFVDVLQEVLSGFASNINLVRYTSTSVRVYAGAGSEQAALSIAGKLRYNAAPVSLTISGSSGTYNIYAIVDTESPSITGSTPSNRGFSLEQNTVAPSATSRKIGEIDWNGTAITSIRPEPGMGDVRFATGTYASRPVDPVDGFIYQQTDAGGGLASGEATLHVGGGTWITLTQGDALLKATGGTVTGDITFDTIRMILDTVAVGMEAETFSGDTTLDADSSILQRYTGAGGHTVELPDVATLSSKPRSYLILNPAGATSGLQVAVATASGDFILAAGQAAADYLYLQAGQAVLVVSRYGGGDWDAYVLGQKKSSFKKLVYTTAGSPHTFDPEVYLQQGFTSGRAKVVSGGGGGGRAISDQTMGAGGAGGGYAEVEFDLATVGSQTVTVGGGGLGGTSGSASAGGDSSFGSLAVTTGGGAGAANGGSYATVGGASAGTIQSGGGRGGYGGSNTTSTSGEGGSSMLGQGAPTAPNGSNAQNGSGFGAGGAGGHRSTTTNRDGGNGSTGVVIVELY